MIKHKSIWHQIITVNIQINYSNKKFTPLYFCIGNSFPHISTIALPLLQQC